jgi:hypothetical protein
MFGLIPWLVVKTGLSSRVVKLGLIAAAIVLAVMAAALWLHVHDKSVIATHETKIDAQVQKQGRVADQKLEERKDAASAKQAAERKEFDNATAHLPKSGLTDRQRIDACEQLRRQRTDPAILARAGCVQSGGNAGP